MTFYSIFSFFRLPAFRVDQAITRLPVPLTPSKSSNISNNWPLLCNPMPLFRAQIFDPKSMSFSTTHKIPFIPKLNAEQNHWFRQNWFFIANWVQKVSTLFYFIQFIMEEIMVIIRVILALIWKIKTWNINQWCVMKTLWVFYFSLSLFKRLKIEE